MENLQAPKGRTERSTFFGSSFVGGAIDTGWSQAREWNIKADSDSVQNKAKMVKTNSTLGKLFRLLILAKEGT